MAKKGVIFTEEHKLRLSESHKGQPAWNKGKKGIYSEDTLRKMSENSKGKNLGKPRSEETKAKISKARKGMKLRPMSEEQKKKLSSILKGKPQDHSNRKSRKGVPIGFIPKGAFKKGAKPWNYIDGRSSRTNMKQRYGEEWPNIREEVLIRDKYVCQKCGIDNVPFEVHHIINYLLTKDNSLDNLVTLCKRCHRKIEAMEMKLLKCKEVA